MPTIECRPETIEAMRARFPRAMEFLYDAKGVHNGAIRPGEVAAQVFDFEDGLRLIVSRLKIPCGCVCLHVSASFPPGCVLYDTFRCTAASVGVGEAVLRWLNTIPARFAQISDKTRDLKLYGFTSMVPHFIEEEHLCKSRE
jgi:hypothetical protein